MVKSEQPQLEESRNEIITKIADGNRQIKQCENDILTRLSHAGDNILEDDSLLTALTNSKELSDEIKEKTAEAAVTMKKI